MMVFEFSSEKSKQFRKKERVMGRVLKERDRSVLKIKRELKDYGNI
jgi:hypothetical protein